MSASKTSHRMHVHSIQLSSVTLTCDSVYR